MLFSVMAQFSTADPIGTALLAFHHGDHHSEITVCSSIAEEDVLPVEYLFRSLAALPDREKKALDLCQGRVLDVGAGAGSHALILQDRGLQVEAIDISAGAVAVMQVRGLRSVQQLDVWELEHGSYDTILMLMNGIGIVGELDRLEPFFRHIQKILAPGGQILVESSDILYMYEEEDGSVLLDLNGAYYGEVEYQMSFQEVVGEPFNWLFVDYPTLQDHVESAGLHCARLLEDAQGHYLARISRPT